MKNWNEENVKRASKNLGRASWAVLLMALVLMVVGALSSCGGFKSRTNTALKKMKEMHGIEFKYLGTNNSGGPFHSGSTNYTLRGDGMDVTTYMGMSDDGEIIYDGYERSLELQTAYENLNTNLDLGKNNHIYIYDVGGKDSIYDKQLTEQGQRIVDAHNSGKDVSDIDTYIDYHRLERLSAVIVVEAGKCDTDKIYSELNKSFFGWGADDDIFVEIIEANDGIDKYSDWVNKYGEPDSTAYDFLDIAEKHIFKIYKGLGTSITAFNNESYK